jgi:hypothetical protein
MRRVLVTVLCAFGGCHCDAIELADEERSVARVETGGVVLDVVASLHGTDYGWRAGSGHSLSCEPPEEWWTSSVRVVASRAGAPQPLTGPEPPITAPRGYFWSTGASEDDSRAVYDGATVETCDDGAGRAAFRATVPGQTSGGWRVVTVTADAVLWDPESHDLATCAEALALPPPGA